MMSQVFSLSLPDNIRKNSAQETDDRHRSPRHSRHLMVTEPAFHDPAPTVPPYRAPDARHRYDRPFQPSCRTRAYRQIGETRQVFEGLQCASRSLPSLPGGARAPGFHRDQCRRQAVGCPPALPAERSIKQRDPRAGWHRRRAAKHISGLHGAHGRRVLSFWLALFSTDPRRLYGAGMPTPWR